MEIRYEINVDDYIEAQTIHFRKRALYYVLVILGSLFILFGFLLIPKIRLGAWPMVALGILYLLWPFGILPLHARYDFRKHPQLRGMKLLHVDDNGISVEGTMSRSQNQWSLYTGFRETPRVLMLYVGARNFMIIPKRAFLGADLDHFRALVRQRVPLR